MQLLRQRWVRRGTLVTWDDLLTPRHKLRGPSLSAGRRYSVPHGWSSLSTCAIMLTIQPRLAHTRCHENKRILKVEIFNTWTCSESRYASTCQILCLSVELLRRYGQFSICITCIWTTHEEHLLVFVTVQNLVGMGAVVSIICQF